MRLVTYSSERGARAGVLRQGGVVDCWGAIDGEGTSVRELLEQERLDDVARADGAVLDLASVQLLPPVPDPQKIVCIGLNYAQHAAETGMEPPSRPTFFAKFANALAAPGATVKLPANSTMVDYEAEIAFVVGRRAKDVPPARALDHVAGYTLLNDLSARDLQGATPQWMPGKVFDGAAPCGPYLVTPDEVGPADAIGIRLTLNGEEMQNGATDDLIFSVPQLVAQLSKLMTLEPGDIVSTGTPEGVGMGRSPRVWLADGDEIAIESPTLGRLVTRINSEQVPLFLSDV